MTTMEVENKVYQKVVESNKAHESLLKGASVLYKAVSSTMGPSGHSVIIDNDIGGPSITKDGVTVARSINLRDRLESMGAELLKEVASKTNELAGDGPQPLYSKILTPNGWKTMGDCKVGDEICGTAGTKQKILGIYPKGTKPVIEIQTSDNRIVECCEDHLWNVVTHYGKKCTLTTKEMMESGVVRFLKNNQKRHKYYIPTTCVEYNNKINEMPIDPYLLGVLLGDGSLTDKRSSVELSLGLHEESILSKLILPEGCNYTLKVYPNKNYIKVRFTGTDQKRKPILKSHLKELGLLGTKSDTKFIPKSYLFSSIKNRQKLLAGLIDTDGHINARGLFEFGTTSVQLYHDVVELCRSLGKQVYAYKVDRKPNSAYGTKSIYRICELKGFKHGIKIKSIQKTNKLVPMQCIKVSNSDHLYITDDYVPTHNTTTATVLAHTLLSEGHKMMNSGRSSIELKRGMDMAFEEVKSFLENSRVDTNNENDIKNVATISANGDEEIGNIICEAIKSVGQDGLIAIEPAKSVKTSLRLTEGIQVDSGFVSPFFITNNDKQVCELEKPYILITANKISSLKDILPVLEQIDESGRPLLIVADEIEGEALHTLVVNKTKGVIKACAIKAPGYGEYRADILADLGCVVDGEVLGATSEVELKNIKLEHLGSCKKAIINRKNTTLIVGENNEDVKEKIDARIDSIRNSLNEDKTLDQLRISKFRDRLAKLSGGIAVIEVGGSTEVEILEKKDRVEDAVNATQAAVQEGIVPGGGTALFYAAQHIRGMIQTGLFNQSDKNMIDDINNDIIAGVELIANACEAPLKIIVGNTGEEPAVVSTNLKQNWAEIKNFCVDVANVDQNDIAKIIYNFKETKNTETPRTKFKYGYNAATHEYGDLVKLGIIDPVKVTRYALEHAISVIGLMLTCDAVVVNEEEEG